MLEVNTCAKIRPQHGLNEQQAMIYLKLRQAGCKQLVARKFCSRSFCRIDQTTKKVGPLECKIITPITHQNCGYHGWEPNLTIKYDLGQQFVLAKDMDMKDSEIEIAVQKKYDKMQEVYETAFKDKIKEVQHYIQESQGKPLIPEGLNKKQLLHKLRNLTSNLRRQNDSPVRYFKHKGQKYHYIVDDVIKDYQENFGTILKEEQPHADTQTLIRQQSDGVDEKLLILQQCWTPSRRNPRIRKSIFSKLNQFEPDFCIQGLTDQVEQRDKFNLNNRSMQNSQVHSMQQIKNHGLTRQMSWFEKSIEDNKLATLKKNLDNIVQPFQSIYNLDPQKIYIQLDDKPKKQINHNNDFQSYQISLNQMNAESELIINLLEQNGISDSLDAQINKSQFDIKSTSNSILLKSSSQPQQLLKIIKSQGAKQKMAKEFNQTQYLFKTPGYKPVKNVQLVIHNTQKNGESINDISLIKSPINRFSRGFSMQTSKKQSVASLINSVENDFQNSRSQKGSFHRSDNQSINSSSQVGSLKVDFNIQLKKLIRDTVEKMNQKGISLEVDDSELKQQRDILIRKTSSDKNHTNQTLSPQNLKRILFKPQIIKSFIKKSN